MRFNTTATHGGSLTLCAFVCTWVLVAGLAGAAPASQSAGQPATRPTTAQSPRVALPPGAEQLTIQLAWADSLLLAPVRINGQDAGWFVVDTGADYTFVDNELIGRLGLRPLGRVQAATATGNTTGADLLEVARIEVGDSRGPAVMDRTLVASVDLKLISTLVGFRLSGLLGCDFLRQPPLTLDTRAGTLTLHTPRWLDGHQPPVAAIPMRTVSRYVPAVPGKIEGREGWLAVDTGKNDALSVHSPFLGLYPEVVDGKHWVPTSASSLGGVSQVRVAVFGDVQAVGRRWSRLPGSSGPTSALTEGSTIGTLGMPMLADALLTFDWAGGRAWAEWLPPESADQMARRLRAREAAPTAVPVPGHDLVGTTALMHAAYEGRLDVVNILLAAGADPSAESRDGWTALLASGNHPAVAAALLAKGAKPDGALAMGGQTALMRAIGWGNTETVKVLLAGRADPNLADVGGHTPLHYAAHANYPQILSLLLAAGANVNAADKNGNTPLHTAASGGADPKLIVALLEAGARIEATVDAGGTPLMLAALNGHAAVAAMLLDRGARIEAAAKDGGTPLMYAAVGGNAETVRLLLSRGADPKAKSRDGKTALDHATARGHMEAVRLLLIGDRRPAASSDNTPTAPASTAGRGL